MNPIRVLWIDCSPFCGGAQKSFGGMLRGLLENDSGEISGCLYYSESGERSWGRGLAGLPGLELRYCRCRHWGRSARGLMHLLTDMLRWHLMLIGELRRRRPDLIHVNGCRGYLLLPWLFCRRIPVVVHDRDFRKPLWLMRFIGLRKRLRVLTVSRWLGEDWTWHFPWVSWEYVPNPVETEPDSGEHSSGAAPVFAMIADWVSWKRHGFFIRALDSYRKKYGECRGAIQGRIHDRAGAGLHREALNLRDSLELSDRLVISEDRSVPEILAEADVLVSCSEEEPFGRTVVEALQHGRCVAAMGKGGPAEILKDCPAGFLTEGGPAEFADRMHEAWLASRNPEIALAARSRGMQFLPEMSAGKIPVCYRAMADRRD